MGRDELSAAIRATDGQLQSLKAALSPDELAQAFAELDAGLGHLKAASHLQYQAQWHVQRAVTASNRLASYVNKTIKSPNDE